MNKIVQLFLSYIREDEEKVENLYQGLLAKGLKPWMDKRDILPGEIWEISIKKAIRNSDFFIACITANSVHKRGVLQKEIREALDVRNEMQDHDIYIIPARLEDCELPENLSQFQCVDLFRNDGWSSLIKAIDIGIGVKERDILSSLENKSLVTDLSNKIGFHLPSLPISRKSGHAITGVELRIDPNGEQIDGINLRLLQFALAGFLGIPPEAIKIKGRKS